MRERELGLYGTKRGMTTVYIDDVAFGVTILEVGPCLVLAKRTSDKKANGKTDGYDALQVGFGHKPERKVNKAEAGHLKAVGGEKNARRLVRELRVTAADAARFEVGGNVTLADIGLQKGDKIDVTGRSQGKGFQGVMRRHHMHGFPMTHGTHEARRHGGSIGCRKFPGRVFKGRRMPGHMGDERVTIQNLKVVEVRPEQNIVLVEGSVPGTINGSILVRKAIKRRVRKN